MSHKFKGLLRHITALVICRRRRRRRRLGSGLQLKLELGMGWAVPKSSVYFCICFTVSQFQSQFRFRFQFHCMILHKTTVSLSSPPLCNPYSPFPYSICPLTFALANLNFWQFLLQSWHHSCSLCSPKKSGKTKNRIPKNRNRQQKQKYWKLVSLFYFRFLLLLFSAHISADRFVIFVYFFCSAVGSINSDWQFAENPRVFGIRQTTWSLIAASFKALKTKPSSGESRLPCQ